MAGLGRQMRGNGIAKIQRQEFKKGGYVDMSEEHEGMESMAEEAKEYAMEEKGYKETKSGKMKKADMLTAKMSKKKKGKMMKGKR
jgi:hypothetical protein